MSARRPTVTFRDDPSLMTDYDRDQIDAFRDFLSECDPPVLRLDDSVVPDLDVRPYDAPDHRLAEHPGLLQWATGEGPAPKTLDRLYGLCWRSDGMGV